MPELNRLVTKAVFPVAGMGTRFLPATKSVPKEIMTLVDRPLIQYAIDEARAAGITEFIFVTSRGKNALEDYFDHAPQIEASLRSSGKRSAASHPRRCLHERTATPRTHLTPQRKRCRQNYSPIDRPRSLASLNASPNDHAPPSHL